MRVLLCPLSDPGFLYPAVSVGLELRRRGAAVHVLGRTSAAPLLAGTELPFLAAEACGGAHAFDADRWFRQARGQYEAVRHAARDTGADVLVTSVLCHGALLAAEALDLPVVVVGLATHLWLYRADGASASRSSGPESLRLWRTREMLRYYEEGRERVGLPSRPAGDPGGRDFPLSGTALLLRGHPLMEEPGAELPERVHHVGPCMWEPAAPEAELDAVRKRLDRVGKSVVYVHLGRVFQETGPWPRLNAAFSDSPFQAVVEVGRSADPLPAPSADLTVVRKPWMGPLIDMAGFVLSHGTSAPVLNALLRGRALGLSPNGSEQTQLTEACVRAGVAVRVPNACDPDPVEVMRRAWQDDGLRARARGLGRRLRAADGEAKAADIVEGVVTGRFAGAL